MSDVNPQAVAETDGQSKTVAEAESAPDLDSILKQYEADTTSSTTSTASTTVPETTTTPDLKAIESRINEFEKRAAMDEYRKDMDGFIKNIRGELDAEIFDDTYVEAWVDAQARKDPRLTKAWLNRKTDPKSIEKIAKAMNKSFTDKFKNLPDRQITSDTEAVVAAVRGASTKTPGQDKPADFKKMSDRDFNKMQNELIYNR